MGTSLKHLLRTPWRTVLFFLLMLASTLLLTLGTVLSSEANQRIQAAEEQFHTIGTVEQLPLSEQRVYIPGGHSQGTYEVVRDFGGTFDLSELQFDGADYVLPPENRPLLFARIPGFRKSIDMDSRNIIEFEAQEDMDGSAPYYPVTLTRIFRKAGVDDPAFVEGGTINLSVPMKSCEQVPIRAGQRYIAATTDHGSNGMCPVYQVYDHQFRSDCMPFTSQTDALGNPVEDGVLLYGSGQMLPVTDGFYESETYALLERWMEAQETVGEYAAIVPTQSLELLPSFHEGNATIVQGRAITEEEFATGAKVVLITQDTQKINGWRVGDTVELPISMAAYDLDEGKGLVMEGLWANPYGLFSISPLNAQGQAYEPYSEGEYEIVGVYNNQAATANSADWDSPAEVGGNTLIIPSASVTGSDENNRVSTGPLNASCTSFEIPNGTIAQFDAALHAAVPEAENLNITYDDGGYSEIMGDLRAARTAAYLLLAAGILASAAVVLLVLYFFVIKQKKRTAIERSLGMSKQQCRVSILSGLLAATLVAVLLGTAVGAVVLGPGEEADGASNQTLSAQAGSEEVPMVGAYRTDFTAWGLNANQELDDSEVHVPPALYGVAPLAIFGAVCVLGLLFVESNLRVEPMELLSGRED